VEPTRYRARLTIDVMPEKQKNSMHQKCIKNILKKQRHHLRELATECHEFELKDALEELYEQFQKWAGKGLNVFELNDIVHEFHNRISRELYKRYVMMDPDFSVAYALNNNILKESAVDEEVLKLLGNMLKSEKSEGQACITALYS